MVPALSIKVPRVSMYSGSRSVSSPFAYGAFTLSGRLSQTFLLESLNPKCGPNPGVHALRFGLFRISLAATNRNRCFFLFLRLLRCFSSPGSPPYVMDWRMDDTSSSYRVSPFRHLWIKDYLHLPAAFRSLSRLSSALSAKASTLRSFLLNLFDA